MANQTLVQVPPNVGEVEVLKRFLRRLVEELDIVLGNRGIGGSFVTSVALNAALESQETELRAYIAAVEQRLLDEINKLQPYYAEIARDAAGLASQVDTWEDNTKTLKLKTQVITRDAAGLASTITTTDDVTSDVETKTITRDAAGLASAIEVVYT